MVVCLGDFDPAVKEAAAWALGYIARHDSSLAQAVVDAGLSLILSNDNNNNNNNNADDYGGDGDGSGSDGGGGGNDDNDKTFIHTT